MIRPKRDREGYKYDWTKHSIEIKKEKLHMMWCTSIRWGGMILLRIWWKKSWVWLYIQHEQLLLVRHWLKHISECYQSLWFYKIKFTERVRKDYMKIKYSKFYLFWKIYLIHINVLYIGKTIWKFWPKDLMVKYIEMLIINAKMNTCVPKTVKSTWALRRRKG